MRRGDVIIPMNIQAAPPASFNALQQRLGRKNVSSKMLGAYPALGAYDECNSADDHKRALSRIAKTGRPRKDPVYGKDGPLLQVWQRKR